MTAGRGGRVLRWAITAAGVLVVTAGVWSGAVASETVPDDRDWGGATPLGLLQVQLRAAEPDSFAGAWFDQAGQAVVALKRGAKQEGSLSLITESGVDPVIEWVSYAEAELENIHRQLALEFNEKRLAGLETDVINNRVNIFVLPTATSGDTDAIRAKFGPAVHIQVVDGQATGNACPNSNCPNPLKAGLRLYRSGTFVCMSGFVMRSITNAYYLSTAGHCSSIGDTYQHPSGVNRGSVSHQGWADYSPADVSLFPISSTQKSNRLCSVPSSGADCIVLSMTTRENPSIGQEVIGQRVCIARQTSNPCGSLISTNNTIGVCKPGGSECRIITNMRRASVAGAPGDSGAPVYYSSKAIGFYSTQHPAYPSDMVYSHVIHTEARFSMSIQISP